MTRDKEFDFYADPKNQTPQGPGRRGNLSEMVPVRFDPETLEALRAAAEADDPSVSPQPVAWLDQHRCNRTRAPSTASVGARG